MGAGGKSKSNFKNPVQLSIQSQVICVGAIRAYAGLTGSEGGELALDQFMESVYLETERPDLSNIGHPSYRPVVVRRVGFGVGLPETSGMVYDNISGKFQAFLQLQEGMRIGATAKMILLDELGVIVGDTLATDDVNYGVHRLWLVEGIDESPGGVELSLVDVLGG